MENVHWILVIVSLVLGLGALRLLVGVMVVLWSGWHDRGDAASLAWAGAVLLQLVAFWWSLAAAGRVVSGWTPLALVLLAGLVLSLVLAAAFVLPLRPLPKGDTLSTRFERDGRWALLALAAFNAITMAANPELWHEGLLTESVRINLVLTVIPLAGFLGGRRVPRAAAAAYVVILVWGVVESAPLGY